MIRKFITSFLVLLLAITPAVIADTKVSQLPTADPLSGSEEIPLNQAGVTKKATVNQVKDGIGLSSHVADVTIHRSIHDSATTVSNLWSAQKINTELSGKANTSHTHNTGDLTSGTLGVARGGTGLSSIAGNRLLYTSDTDLLAPLQLGPSLNITGGILGIVNNQSIQQIKVKVNGADIGTRQEINLVGSGLSVSGSDNAGSNRVDVTFTQSALAFPKGYLSGPPPQYNSASSLLIPAGLKARNSSNTADIEIPSNITLSLASSGAAGLDTGTEAANTWYYVYLIKKSSDGTVSAVFSTTNEVVTGSITLPAGYDLKRQLPIAVRNDGSSNMIPIMAASGWPNRPLWVYKDLEFDPRGASVTTALNNGTAATFTDVSLSSLVPPVSQLPLLRLVALDNAGTGDDYVYFRRNGDTTNGIKLYAMQNFAGRTFETHYLPTDSAQIVEYNCSGLSGVSAFIQVMGFVVTEIN